MRPEAMEIHTEQPQKRNMEYVFSAIINDYDTHGNVLRYFLTSNGVDLYADVLFRSSNVYAVGQKVYVSLEKRDCLSIV